LYVVFVLACTQQTVSKDDILLEEDADDEEEEQEYFDSDLYKGQLRLPRIPTAAAAVTTSSTMMTNATSLVPNCCVICLEEYQPGSIVVWSTNPDCEHAFHRDCIVKYFDKIQRRVADTPCPCCRAKYTDMSVEIRAKKPGRRRRIRTTTGVNLLQMGLPSLWFR
jgi:hypothetical protein